MSRKLRFLPFLLAPLFAAPLAAHAAPTYTIATIASLGSGSSPQAMNASGQVVGYTSGPAGVQAFVGGAGNLTSVHPTGAVSSAAFGINDAGVAAGQIERPAGAYRAVTFSGGAVTDIGSLGNADTSSAAWGINNSGQVAGASYAVGGALHAFLYTPGSGMIDLGTLGGDESYGRGINASGAVTGYTQLASGDYRAFSYFGGAMHDLGTLVGGNNSEGYGINDSGAVAGVSSIAGGAVRAFMSAGGIMVDLGTFGGDSRAYDINSAGQVVGGAELTPGRDSRAFLYSGGTLTDLNSLVDPSLGWTLTYAAAINDKGQIAAEGCKAGRCEALLLNLVAAPPPVNDVPEPEPYTALLLALGLAGFIGRRRKSGAGPYGLGR